MLLISGQIFFLKNNPRKLFLYPNYKKFVFSIGVIYIKYGKIIFVVR